MSSFKEAQVIKEVLKGNVNEYEKLIEKYQNQLYGYILNLVRDSHMTEDIVQESFVKAYNNLHKFNKSKEFSSWLITIGRNTAFNYLKKNKRMSSYDHIESIVDENSDEDKNNPELILEKSETSRIIDEVINDLPEKYSRLIKLKYFNELSYREISERIGISEEKIKWMLYESRKKMLKIYKSKVGKEVGGESYGLY